MSKPTNRLFDLEIDEVSTVDRPANQHGLISIAKAAEDGMGADELVLEHGQDYVDDDGNVFMYVELNDEGEPLPVEGVNFELDADGELEAIEAEFSPADVGKARGIPGGLLSGGGGKHKTPGLLTGVKSWAKKNPGKASAIGAGGAGVAGGGAYMMAEKSAGTDVLEALSKAVTESDRDQIVAKMADDLAATQAENEAISKALEEERDIRITEAFIAKAAEYDLPVAPEVFGPILKAVALVLDDEDLEILDEVLSAKAGLYDELGYGGGASNSGTMSEVEGLASEIVGKAAGTLSLEQAVSAVYETNPAAYEAYLAEQNGR